jgi:hypothetical protein
LLILRKNGFIYLQNLVPHIPNLYHLNLNVNLIHNYQMLRFLRYSLVTHLYLFSFHLLLSLNSITLPHSLQILMPHLLIVFALFSNKNHSISTHLLLFDYLNHYLLLLSQIMHLLINVHESQVKVNHSSISNINTLDNLGQVLSQAHLVASTSYYPLISKYFYNILINTLMFLIFLS